MGGSSAAADAAKENAKEPDGAPEGDRERGEKVVAARHSCALVL